MRDATLTSSSPSKKTSRRHTKLLTAALISCAAPLLGPAAVRGIEHAGAEAIVRAPNSGRAAPSSPMAGDLLVDVGPPAATLSIRVVDAPEPRGTVFVLHGIRASKEAMTGWGDMLARAGYRAVLVDLRGHGRSSGDFLSYGVRESADLSRVLDALEAKGMRAGPVGVMGASYGAATAIQWAGRDERVRAVVAVAPFASLRDVVPGYVPVPMPQSVITRSIDLAGQIGGFDPDDADSVRAAARTHAALLLVHGRADWRIPFAHSERIYDAARDHAELVLVDDAGHESVIWLPATRLDERARAWFDAKLAVPEARDAVR